MRWTKLVTSTAFLALTMATAASAHEDMSEVLFRPESLYIEETGSFLGKTWHEMNTKEFHTALKTICAGYCEGAVPAIEAAIHDLHVERGGNYVTTGVVQKHDGNQWWLAFPAPDQYVTCDAKVDRGSVSVDDNSSLGGGIYRGQSGNWVGTYAAVPQNTDRGHSVQINFVAKFVRNGTEPRHNCKADGTIIWDYHNGAKKL